MGVSPHQVEKGVRRHMDNWRPWVVILAVGLIAVNVWTLTIYRTQASEEAARTAQIVSNAEGQERSCIASIPILTKINQFIVGDRIIRDALIANAKASVRSTPRSSPQRATRVANLHRLEQAREKAYEVRFPVPTKRECVALRAKLLKSGKKSGQPESIPATPTDTT